LARGCATCWQQTDGGRPLADRRRSRQADSQSACRFSICPTERQATKARRLSLPLLHSRGFHEKAPSCQAIIRRFSVRGRRGGAPVPCWPQFGQPSGPAPAGFRCLCFGPLSPMSSVSFGTAPEPSRAPRGGWRNSPAPGEFLQPRTLDGEDPFRTLVARERGHQIPCCRRPILRCPSPTPFAEPLPKSCRLPSR
jgi:hypothetical protein